MQKQIDDSVNFLSSQPGLDSLRTDPYWPKWNGPWWHMQCLFELGEAMRIPPSALNTLIVSMEHRFPKFFPLSALELPTGADLRRDSSCHCQLGMVYQVLFSAGIDVDIRMPWLRPWFFKYQLPDGGFNCDHAAYFKPEPKSSIVSSLPPFEAVIFCTPRPFNNEELRFLERGAHYLIRHDLYKSTAGKTINKDWLQPCFPHFYEYSVLRGLRFLNAWSRRTNSELPRAIRQIEVAQEVQFFVSNGIRLLRRSFASETTTLLPVDTERHRIDAAKTFELLDEVSKDNTVSLPLWNWFKKS